MKFLYASIILIGGLIASLNLHAKMDALGNHISNGEKVGEVRFKYLWFNIYDVALYSPQGKFDPNKNFALYISYLRDVSGKQIASSSAKAIKGQGFQDKVTLAHWESEMHDLFPDVKEGDSLIGIADNEKGAIFYHNGFYLGKIESLEFQKYFFNIWIGEDSDYPKLTKKLTGRK